MPPYPGLGPYEMKRDIDNFRALIFLSAVTLSVAVWFGFSEMPLTDAQVPYMEGVGVGTLIEPMLLFSPSVIARTRKDWRSVVTHPIPHKAAPNSLPERTRE